MRLTFSHCPLLCNFIELCVSGNLSEIVVDVNAAHNSLSVSWTAEYRGPNKQMLQSYFVYFREVGPRETVTMFGGRDGCNDRSVKVIHFNTIFELPQAAKYT